jgi:hypothetical protein
MEIKFIEHKIAGYASRTIENVKSADLTIAFAINFDTLGEQLTRKIAGLKYCSVQIQELPNGQISVGGLAYIAKVVDAIGYHEPTVLNIAGNGIYSFLCKQSVIDAQIEHFLTMCLGKVDVMPVVIRTGGQTGIDEAGLKAARTMDIQPICLAPKGWVFRNDAGQDIADEKLFKERFKESKQ